MVLSLNIVFLLCRILQSKIVITQALRLRREWVKEGSRGGVKDAGEKCGVSPFPEERSGVEGTVKFAECCVILFVCFELHMKVELLLQPAAHKCHQKPA